MLPIGEAEVARLARVRATLLGGSCTVVSGGTTSTASGGPVQGMLLEVRRLWLPPPPPLTAASAVKEREKEACGVHDDNGTAWRPRNTNMMGIGSFRDTTHRRILLSRPTQGVDGPLYGFVRVRDGDHRLSGWVPLHSIRLKYPRGLHPDRWAAVYAASHANSDDRGAGGSGNDHTDTTTIRSSYDYPRGGNVGSLASPDMPGGFSWPPVGSNAVVAASASVTLSEWDAEEIEGPASDIVTAPLLSDVYGEVTPGMARTQRAKKQLDYLEERLIRDGKTPTTVRFFVYANRYVFRPWYFAPFGLLHRSYDPLLPVAVKTGAKAEPTDTQGSSCNASHMEAETTVSVTNPYIRDAYLCPFSLRVFTTYDQLRYETAQYRGQRLRPPGYEIYRDTRRGFSVFEINGSHNVTYCRHLFLIGKSFLENKLAGHDVHSYYFYVVCLHEWHLPGYLSTLQGTSTGITATAATAATSADDSASEPAAFFAGFFTWEKQVSECNLACIVTLPCFAGTAPSSKETASTTATGDIHGNNSTSILDASPTVPRGIGQLMIAISYELAYRRRQVGSPERPLSDLGAAAYQRYWRRVLVKWLYQLVTRAREGVHGHQDGHHLHGAAAGVSAHTAIDVEADLSPPVPVVQNQRRRRGRPAGSRGRGRGRGRGEATTNAAAAAAANTPITVPSSASSSRSSSSVSSLDAHHSRSHSSSSSASLSSSPFVGAHTDNYGSAHGAPVEESVPVVSVQEMAREVGLEESDVLRTLLGMGLLHRSSEDHSIRIVVPEAFVTWEYGRIEQQARSLTHCAFDPALLVDAKNVRGERSVNRSGVNGGGGRRRA